MLILAYIESNFKNTWGIAEFHYLSLRKVSHNFSLTLPQSYFFLATALTLLYTTVSTKVVPQKCKSVRDNADWYYG